MMHNTEYDLHSLNRLPIIYTTRLEDMAILRKQLSNLIFEDVINTIITDSKPHYVGSLHLMTSSNVTKPYNFFFKKLKLKRNNRTRDGHGIIYITDIGKCRKKQKTHRNISSKGESKIEDSTKNLTSGLINEPERIIESEIQTDLSKQKLLVALCKPLQVILEDINLIVPKKVDNQNNKVLVISSDDDDDHIIPETVITAVDSTQYPKKYTIKSIQVFENCLKKHDIKNTVILMYNLFLNKVEICEIDVQYNVKNFITIRFCDIQKMKAITKFNNKHKSIFNVIVCCWKNRQSYVLLLNSYKKYSDITQYMCIQHPCKELHCECCCTNADKNCNIDHFNKQINLNNLIAAVSKRLFFISHKEPHHILKQSTHKKSDNLITAALKFPSLFKKEAKWRGIEGNTHIYNNSFYKHECSRLLNLRNNNDNSEELYEFGSFPNSSSDSIYSKVTYNDKPNSSWLLNTFSVPQEHLVCKYTDPKDRDNYISRIKKSSCIPLTSYLKMPTTLLNEDSKKEETILSNSGELCTPEVTGYSNALALEQSDTSRVEDTRVSDTESDLENNVTKTINSLIKGIMYRFRDVRLIINSEGKVSAALNAALNTLTSSELMILSEILANAQTQVDKLGLKPGIYLNPNSTLSFISPSTQNANNTTGPNVSENNKPKTSLNPNLASPMSFISYPPQNFFNSAQTNVAQNCKPGMSLNPNSPTSFSSPHILVNLTDTNVVEKDKLKSANSYSLRSFISHSSDNLIKSTEINVSEKNVNENNQQSENNSAKSKILLSFSKMICEKKKEYETSFRNYISHRTQLTPKITNVFSLNSTSCIFTNILENKEIEDHSNINNNSVNNPNIIKNMCLKEIETSLSLIDSEQDSIAPKPSNLKKRLRPYSLNYPNKNAKIRVKNATEMSLSSNVDNSNVANYQQIYLNNLPVKEPIDYIAEPGPSGTSQKAVVDLDNAQVSPLDLYGPLPMSSDLVTNSYRLRDLLISEPKKMWFPPTYL